MNQLLKSHIALPAVCILATFFSSCHQEAEESLTPADLYDKGLSVEEIASRLNAHELELPERVELSDTQSRTSAASEIIRFDDGGVCDIQNAAGLPGCTTNNFSDPVFSYFYTLEKAYFFVHQSLGPGHGLANAGDQTYFVLGLQHPDVNSWLASSGHWWTRYYMKGVSNKTIYFDLEKIRNKSHDITLWFLKDGKWFYWANLGAANWNVSAHAKGISEFQIRASSALRQETYLIDDIVVSNITDD